MKPTNDYKKLRLRSAIRTPKGDVWYCVWLMIIYVVYLALGAKVFSILEGPQEVS